MTATNSSWFLGVDFFGELFFFQNGGGVFVVWDLICRVFL